MVQKLIKGVVLVAVLGGLLVGAVKVHLDNQAQTNAQASKVDSQLTSAVNKLDSLTAQFNQYKQTATTQFNTDQQQLCGFITSHVNTKTVTVPSECTTKN